MIQRDPTTGLPIIPDLTPPIRKRVNNHKLRHENGGADEISVTGLSGLLADDQHVLDAEVTAVAVAHALATAANDFLVASGAGVFVKKTLTETLAILAAPLITDKISLTAQVADIADTAFAGNTAGVYRLSYYILDTTADALAGAVTLNIKFTDNGAARTISTSPVVLSALTGFAQGDIVVRLASGNITYGVTHTGIFGTADYALYLTLERII